MQNLSGSTTVDFDLSCSRFTEMDMTSFLAKFSCVAIFVIVTTFLFQRMVILVQSAFNSLKPSYAYMRQSI